VELTPDLAIRVIREFIMPLFKIDRQQQDQKRRLADIGLSSPELFKGGVFSELKLSDSLAISLEATRGELAATKRELSSQRQSNQLASSSVAQLQRELVARETQQHSLRLQYSDLLMENQTVVQRSQGKETQIEEYKRSIALLEQQNLKLVSEIQEERDKRDIRLDL
jgi:chromosome segregation ATPase